MSFSNSPWQFATDNAVSRGMLSNKQSGYLRRSEIRSYRAWLQSSRAGRAIIARLACILCWGRLNGACIADRTGTASPRLHYRVKWKAASAVALQSNMMADLQRKRIQVGTFLRNSRGLQMHNISRVGTPVVRQFPRGTSSPAGKGLPRCTTSERK